MLPVRALNSICFVSGMTTKIKGCKIAKDVFSSGRSNGYRKS